MQVTKANGTKTTRLADFKTDLPTLHLSSVQTQLVTLAFPDEKLLEQQTALSRAASEQPRDKEIPANKHSNS